MENEMIEIPLNVKLNDFEIYLAAHDRCIFSSKFGNGKSYFLNKFIQHGDSKYLFIPIYPINYQIADNKDILEYIKRDILIRLLMSDGVEIDDCVYQRATMRYMFLYDNGIDILLESLKTILPNLTIGSMRWDLSKFVDFSRKMQSKFKEYSEKNANEESKVNDFVDSFENKKGSIFEFDAISQMICDINERYKKKNTDKEIVLIIEDLDRIAPAHIFRILNIFSAHIEHVNYSKDMIPSYQNKFLFDKIITVCDYENIRNIYAHFYGIETDFNGYISKFSSGIPFYYSLSDGIVEYLKRKIREILKDNGEISLVIAELVYQKYVEYNQTNKNDIYSTLREIDHALNKKPCIRNEKIFIDDDQKYYIQSKNNFTLLLDLLVKTKIDFEEFYDHLIEVDSGGICLIEFIGTIWYTLNIFRIFDKQLYYLGDYQRIIFKSKIEIGFIKEFNLDYFLNVYYIEEQLKKIPELYETYCSYLIC